MNSYLAGCLTAPFNELLRARLPDFPTVRFVQCIRLLELKNEWFVAFANSCAPEFLAIAAFTMPSPLALLTLCGGNWVGFSHTNSVFRCTIKRCWACGIVVASDENMEQDSFFETSVHDIFLCVFVHKSLFFRPKLGMVIGGGGGDCSSCDGIVIEVLQEVAGGHKRARWPSSIPPRKHEVEPSHKMVIRPHR